MPDQQFTGDKKVPLRSPLAAPEKRIVQWLTPRFPRFLETNHLTMMTVAWSAGLIAAGYLAARSNVQWLWLSSAMLFLQWFTDSLDGSIGRYRNTGLRKWGFYMDHFLDYVFMACVFTHYAFLVDHKTVVLLFVWALVYGGMEANSWLEYGATGQFKITYLGAGPTEVRLLFICINTGIIYGGIDWFRKALPWALGVVSVMLVFIVWRNSRRLWAIDMADKAADETVSKTATNVEQ